MKCLVLFTNELSILDLYKLKRCEEEGLKMTIFKTKVPLQTSSPEAKKKLEEHKEGIW